MEIEEVGKMLNALDSCISRIKWRLKPHSKQRLENDILSLCTGLRGVVLVDYGGKMPKLQDRLGGLFHHLRKESTILLPLRLMVIEDMIYMIHAKGLAELASSSLISLDPHLIFVDLEQFPPKMLLPAESNIISAELLSIQKLFKSLFPVDVDVNLLPVVTPSMVTADEGQSEICKDFDLNLVPEHTDSQPPQIIDLSSIVDDTQIILPTVNGWLLGYPVVYMFTRETTENAHGNLAKMSLHIFKIIACRNEIPGRRQIGEVEIMSFTVPCDLSLEREKELFAEAFLARMKAKFERCSHVWKQMRLEVRFTD